jgi:phenylalanyl-tRNA synthetase beta chain
VDALDLARLVVARAGVPVVVQPAAGVMPWHPGRCAALLVAGAIVGYAGELHPRVVENTGLPKRSVAFELDLTAIVGAASGDALDYVPVSVYPAAKEDFAFVVPADTPAQVVADAVIAGAGELMEDVTLFDVYTGSQLADGTKSLAYSVRLRSGTHTLTADEVRAVREAIVSAAAKIGAVLR